MPGKPINYKQKQLYLNARLNGCTQETAAAKGGFSVRTGRRIEKGQHQPNKRSHVQAGAFTWRNGIIRLYRV